MKSFKDTFDQYRWEDVQASILAKTSKEVESALAATHRTPEDFKALISPALYHTWCRWSLNNYEKTFWTFALCTDIPE